MSVNDELADAVTARTITLARYDASLRRDVLKLLRAVEKDILAALPAITSETRKARLNKQLAEVRAIISSGYSEIIQLTDQGLTELAGIEAKWQRTAVNRAIGVDIASAMPSAEQLAAIASNTLIQGAPSADWWGRQSADLQFQFVSAVRLGLAQGETNAQITKRVMQAMEVSRRNATTLVRTSVQAVAIAARDASMQANSDVIKGKVSIATLDGRTTPVCAAYSGTTYTLENEPIPPTKLPYLAIPRHFSCRSVWSPITKSFRDLGLDIDDFTPSTRASMDGQVPASTTFAEFLERKGEAWQDEFLGKGKAKLWRDGKITLSDLIDATGRELTLSELRAL